MRKEIQIERLIDYYKRLHRIPETGFSEFETSEFIWNILSNVPSLKLFKVAGTGILAFLKGNRKNRIAFRTDMDGLPLIEKTGLPYASSKKGYMHACGHDGHMACMIEFINSAIKIKERPDILFIFQPAEEGPGGAEAIMESKEFNQYMPEMIFGFHVFPELPAGKVGCSPGAFMAGTKEFNLNFKGKEAHAASGTEKNSLLAGVECVWNIKKRIENEILNEHIFHFGEFISGKKANIVASDCFITGTMRAFEDETIILMTEILKKEAEKIAKKRDLKVEISFPSAYPVLKNHEKQFRLLQNCVENEGISFERIDKRYFGEDFAFFLKKIPGVFFFLGVGDKKCKGALHTDDFCFDPVHLIKGIDIFMSIVDALAKE